MKIRDILTKIFALFIILLFAIPANARPFANPINAVIKKAAISNSALIAVSFKEISNGKKAFEMNEKTPMSPASIQKIVTLLPSLNTLGENYEFKTQLYKGKDNNLYLKLSGDPLLTSKDLRSMIRELEKNKIYSTKAFYIDDSVMDGNEWGNGWQWTDDLCPSMPKFGAYNLDSNLFTASFIATVPGAPAEIVTNVFYPTAFMNNVITGNKTDIKLERKNYISPDVINADGMISRDIDIAIPVNYPRRYFILRLEEILRKQKVAYYGDFARLKLPKGTYLISETKHSISTVTDTILKNSNNMMAETVFKVAGGTWAKETGSTDAAVEMLNDYYKKLGISTEGVKIVDASGVSKDNLMTADFITDVLLKTSQNKSFDLKAHMAGPGEGTLTDRMLYFKDNLKAKTGTLSSISSLAGYITTKDGKTYAFCIIVNDPKSTSSDKKSFEEYVLREAYDKL